MRAETPSRHQTCAQPVGQVCTTLRLDTAFDQKIRELTGRCRIPDLSSSARSALEPTPRRSISDSNFGAHAHLLPGRCRVLRPWGRARCIETALRRLLAEAIEHRVSSYRANRMAEATSVRATTPPSERRAFPLPIFRTCAAYPSDAQAGAFTFKALLRRRVRSALEALPPLETLSFHGLWTPSRSSPSHRYTISRAIPYPGSRPSGEGRVAVRCESAPWAETRTRLCLRQQVCPTDE